MANFNYRKLRAETLERRTLMAADLSHNAFRPEDVNDDDHITPMDALLVINELSTHRKNSSHASDDGLFRDVNDDSQLSPLDALMVVNELHNLQSSSLNSVQTRIASPDSSAMAKFELEHWGTETEIKIAVRNAPVNAVFDVRINDIVLGELHTDHNGRGRLELSGDANSSSQPLPESLTSITKEDQLIIGDLLQGKLSATWSNSSDGSGSSKDDNSSNDDNSSDDNSSDDNSSDDNSSDDNSSDDNSSDDNSANTFHSVALFSPQGTLHRKAEFEREVESGQVKQKLKVEIEGARSQESFDVKIGNVVIGVVTTDSKGRAKMTWSSSPETNQSQLPSDLVVDGNSTITIGDASQPLVVVA